MPRQAWGNWDTARNDAAAAAAHVQCDVSGTYRDEWKDAHVIVLEQSGGSITASSSEWGRGRGTLEGREVKIWSLVGSFQDEGMIAWRNGGAWKRDPPAPREAAAADQAAGDPVGTEEMENPWKEADAAQAAAPAVGVSGTYADPWQGGALTVFKQDGTRLVAEGHDGSWGPEQGTIHGTDINIFGLSGKYEAGRISWSNENVWEQTEGAAAAATPVPAEAAPAGSSPDASGTYSDPWQNGAFTVLVQRGSELTASAPDGSWGPDHGTIDGTSIKLFGMTAELRGGTIAWDHGGVWNREPDASAGGAAAAAGGAAAAADNRAAADAWNAWGATAAPAGGAAAAADPWAAGGGPAGVEASSDAKKAARQKEFYQWQFWYKQENTLPGKTPEEVAEDEEKLFPQVEGDRAGICFDLYNDVTCNISGPKSENIPQLTTFEALYEEFSELLPSELVENIRRCGFKRPTPVQKFSIPAALSGRDIMCCAQTGSGKTAAFLVPILASMIKNSKATGILAQPYEGPCKPDTLVLSPTRELCLQTYDEAIKFCHKTPHRVVRVYGQERVAEQIALLARGGDLCIATPGRLWDFVDSGIVEVTEVNCLVLDEADRMLSMKMESFIREVVENFGMPPKDSRQTLMFSATFPPDCQKLAEDYLFDHIWIGVGAVGGAVGTISQTLLQVTAEDKFEKLYELLNQWLDKREANERLLVFANTKAQAKALDEFLYERNIDTGALHGDLPQKDREKNLDRFRKGEIDVLVGTDLASRGLDIAGVSEVINYDLPWESEMYVQRIGRTGRIGHKGKATSFVTVSQDGSLQDDQKMLMALPKILQDSESGCDNEVPAWLTEYCERMEQLGSEQNSWGSYRGTTGQTDPASQSAWGDSSAGGQADAWKRSEDKSTARDGFW